MSLDAFSAFEEVGLDNDEKIKEMGMKFRNTILGKGGGKAASLVNLSVIVPSKSTARVQEMHIFIGHILCDLIEEGLNLKK